MKILNVGDLVLYRKNVIGIIVAVHHDARIAYVLGFNPVRIDIIHKIRITRVIRKYAIA